LVFFAFVEMLEAGSRQGVTSKVFCRCVVETKSSWSFERTVS
jgi:hypothetical protein